MDYLITLTDGTEKVVKFKKEEKPENLLMSKWFICQDIILKTEDIKIIEKIDSNSSEDIIVKIENPVGRSINEIADEIAKRLENSIQLMSI